MTAEITRDEFDAFKADITARLNRIETKLDESMKCQGQKLPRMECTECRSSIWKAIDAARRLIWIGLGVVMTCSVLVPILIIAIMKG